MNEPPTGKREDEQRLGSEGAPSPLPYESPRDRAKREPALNVLGMTFAFVGGFFGSLALTLWISLVIALGMGDSRTGPRVLGIICLGLFVAAMAGISLLRRAAGRRTVGRWGLLGLLLGTGIGMLIDGVCFVAR